MVVGVGTAAYAFSSSVQALVQSEIVAALDERRRQRELKRMRDHYIVCGAGSELSGHKLRDTRIRSELDVVIAAIRRRGGEMTYNPSADTLIKEGDMLVALGRAESLVALNRMARGAGAGAHR